MAKNMSVAIVADDTRKQQTRTTDGGKKKRRGLIFPSPAVSFRPLLTKAATSRMMGCQIARSAPWVPRGLRLRAVAIRECLFCRKG